MAAAAGWPGTGGAGTASEDASGLLAPAEAGMLCPHRPAAIAAQRPLIAATRIQRRANENNLYRNLVRLLAHIWLGSLCGALRQHWRFDVVVRQVAGEHIQKCDDRATSAAVSFLPSSYSAINATASLSVATLPS